MVEVIYRWTDCWPPLVSEVVFGPRSSRVNANQYPRQVPPHLSFWHSEDWFWVLVFLHLWCRPQKPLTTSQKPLGYLSLLPFSSSPPGRQQDKRLSVCWRFVWFACWIRAVGSSQRVVFIGGGGRARLLCNQSKNSAGGGGRGRGREKVSVRCSFRMSVCLVG